MKTRYWISDPPSHCDICDAMILEEFVTGRVRGNGVWVVMCLVCHRGLGVGLGVGKGQRYKRTPEFRWQEIEG